MSLSQKIKERREQRRKEKEKIARERAIKRSDLEDAAREAARDAEIKDEWNEKKQEALEDGKNIKDDIIACSTNRLDDKWSGCKINDIIKFACAKYDIDTEAGWNDVCILNQNGKKIATINKSQFYYNNKGDGLDDDIMIVNNPQQLINKFFAFVKDQIVAGEIEYADTNKKMSKEQNMELAKKLLQAKQDALELTKQAVEAKQEALEIIDSEIEKKEAAESKKAKEKRDYDKKAAEIYK